MNLDLLRAAPEFISTRAGKLKLRGFYVDLRSARIRRTAIQLDELIRRDLFGFVAPDASVSFAYPSGGVLAAVPLDRTTLFVFARPPTALALFDPGVLLGYFDREPIFYEGGFSEGTWECIKTTVECRAKADRRSPCLQHGLTLSGSSVKT